MTKKRAGRDNLREIVTAVHGGAIPPSSAIRKSMARLRRTILEREKHQSALRDECAAIARKINAPIFDLFKSDARSAQGLKALQKFRRNRKPSLPPLPKAPKFHSGIGAGSVYSYLGMPYFHWADGNLVEQSGLAQAEPDGALHGIVHPNGGGGWVWCGVGLPFRPLFARTLVAIQPIMPYAFNWWGIGSWGFTAHTRGSLGVYVWEYDLNWSLRSSGWTFQTPIWNHTTETGHSESGSATKSDRVALFMRNDSNYMVWATLEIYCNDSKGSWFGSSDAYGEMQAQCPVIVFAQFPH
jgi:hypothetical protein